MIHSKLDFMGGVRHWKGPYKYQPCYLMTYMKEQC